MKLFKKFLISLFVVFTLLISSCKENEYKSRDFFAMDTYVTLIYQGSFDAENTTKSILSETEKIFSKTISESDIYKINNNVSCTVSDKCIEIINKNIEIANATNGAFNPALEKIVGLWDITGKKYVPNDKEINELLPYCNYNDIIIDGNTVTKKHDQTALDLGASVKGYTADIIINTLKEMGVENAMISIGGNIGVIGESYGRNGFWRVAIKNPFKPDEIAGYIDLTDSIIAVSGDYERYFEANGEIYHHIFDSKTGYPADSGVKSVAVISNDGLLSDALSTALFCMGTKKAINFYNNSDYSFEAVIFNNDKTITLTDGIKNSFVLSENCGLIIE